MRLPLAVLAIFSLGVTLAGADFTGTWKLNLEKSKLPSTDSRSSQIMTITQTGTNTYKIAVDTLTKSGEQRHEEYNRIYDGKEHPATGSGAARGLTEICEQIDPSTQKVTGKINGKVVGQLTSIVSSDGRTLTTGPNGNEAVFDRQ
jgi:hypothetical protein